jgi:hypothetical protein
MQRLISRALENVSFHFIKYGSLKLDIGIFSIYAAGIGNVLKFHSVLKGTNCFGYTVE